MKKTFLLLVLTVVSACLTIPVRAQSLLPDSIQMTFQVDMKIAILSAKFVPAEDYLCVSGNFNKYGVRDSLFDANQDSIYVTSLYIHPDSIGGDTIRFKFHVNGDTAAGELAGQDARIFVLTEQGPNQFSCTYDNKVYSMPYVTDVYIQGQYIMDQVITGVYSFNNSSGILEGKSLYQWYRADTVGAPLEAIDTANSINYTVDTLDIGKYLVFEVTPVALGGDSVTGQPVRAWSPWPAANVGIGEHGRLEATIYPNPTSGSTMMKAGVPIHLVTIFDMNGRVVADLAPDESWVSLDFGALPSGTYFVRAISREGAVFTGKVIRQ